MSIAAEIGKIQAEKRDDDGFNGQLQRMRELREQQGAASGSDRVGMGVDRSRDLSPVLRPTIVRTLSR